MNRILRIVNILIGVLLVSAAAAAYWFGYRVLAQTSGSLRLPVAKPATVARDAQGVPFIKAESLEDAVFLQGYVHAQDRLWQMDALRRLAAGELAEVVGAAAIESDQESRRLRMRRLAEQHARQMPEEERRLFAAYARGVNRFIETHRNKLPIEFTLLAYDPRPWSISDSVLAGMQMFRSLTGGWKDEILKQAMLAKGDPAKVQELFPVATGDEVQLGSNAWAVSGKWTASGKPLLANDTHLEWSFPGPWYVVHLQAPNLHVNGFSLPGLPFVIIGHNDRIAWGITNLHFDVQDLYLENMDPRSGRYIYKGQIEQARQEVETIRVKNGRNIDLTVWVTRHGPIFQSLGNSHFALRWTGMEKSGFAYPFADINRAANWDQFLAALKRVPGPGSNVLYADVDGNIGYHAVGLLPARTNHNGDLPTPGMLGASEWESFIPFEDLPSAYNPPSGLLITANQNPFPKDYRYRVNGSFPAHYRSRQIEALLKARTGWKPGDMLRVQTDVYSAFSHRLAKELVAVWEKRGQKNAALREPAELLKAWNGQMQPGQSAPLIVTLAFQQLRRVVADRASGGQGSTYEIQIAPGVLEKLIAARPSAWFTDFDGMLLKCFADAIDEGRKLQGDNVAKWDYGQYTRFALQHPVLSRVPYVGRYFVIGPVPMAGASTTVKQTSRRLGPSMRFIADLADWENSLQSVTIGQSGQVFSPHFRDQWNDYYAGRAFPMPFARVTAKATLEIQPE